ncbi:unnamed protein product [Cunninghamella blakesleeana]
MFIPKSIKRKQPFIDNHELHINKKQVLDKDQTKSNQLSTTITTTYEKEETVVDNRQKIKVDHDSSINTINNTNDIAVDNMSIPETPTTNEPTCVICGKYGEYINDETDHDICSMECKYIDTDLTPKSMHNSTKNNDIIKVRIPQHYTADNVHAKYTNYMESESVRSLTKSDTKAILKANGIQVNGIKLPRPITSFEQCYDTLGDQLYQNIEQIMGWHMCTNLQRMAIPIGLAGRDMIVTAPTHSGKTASYLIPSIVHCQSLNKLHQYKRRGGPYTLIIAPTRELCQQIESITKKLSTQIRCLRTALLIGGQPIASQLYRLRKGVQIIIGTPGRIVDIATHHPHLLRLWMIRLIILDEADAIFGLGFEQQMKDIFQKLSNKANIQKFIFSATLPTSSSTENNNNNHHVKKKIQQYLNDEPVEIKLQLDDDIIMGNDDRQDKKEDNQSLLLPSPLVRQTILWVENDKKAKKLFSILNNPKYFLPPILIFVESRLGAEFLSRAIQKKNKSLRVVTMHADKDQQERQAVIDGMNHHHPQSSTSKKKVLTWDIVVTTDILARGVDLPSVKLVINYDMASTEEDYIHRIGRAITEGTLPKYKKHDQQRGLAITFINKEHEYLLSRFTKMLSNKSLHQVTPLPSQLKKYL